MLLYRMIRPWLLIEWIYRLTKYGREEEKQRKDLFDTCFKLVKEKRDLLQNKDHISNNDIKKNKNISLLEYMVEINEKNPCFSDEDIVEECCTFMLAGQDSVGTAIAMTIFLLANHPKWQNKCIEEIDEIFNGDTRFPTISDLKEMKCLEMCIKESLRLYPSVPIIGRILGEDIKIGMFYSFLFCCEIIHSFLFFFFCCEISIKLLLTIFINNNNGYFRKTYNTSGL